MTDFLKIAKSIVVHFAHICAYGVETVKLCFIKIKIWHINFMTVNCFNMLMMINLHHH